MPKLLARSRFRAAFAPLLLATWLAGCASTQVDRAPSPAAQATHPAFIQAGELAREAATLDPAGKAAHARQIAQLLADVDNAALQRDSARLPAGDPLYDYAGKALLERGLPLPRPFDNAAAWQFDLNARPPAEADGYRPPVKLAVLLPLSGDLSSAAIPVRDGLLAGYYGETRRRPDIQFHDTAAAGGVARAYAAAVAAGADFVIGPLGRDEVDRLFAQPELPVPVLALNRGNTPPPAGTAGFSLAPEDDGQIAADHLVGLGHRKVLLIAGNDDYGVRAASAFRQRLQQTGGEVVRALSVGENPGDQSAVLATLAGQQVDAVFLAVRGGTARLLTPQLALAGLAGKPRIGTSQLAAGTGRPDQDSALDGILFPTETWTSRGIAGLPAASRVANVTPSARGNSARLFAFGFDAWKLAAYLEKLARTPDSVLPGATGTLKLDGFGNIVRTPSWATFSAGVAVPARD